MVYIVKVVVVNVSRNSQSRNIDDCQNDWQSFCLHSSLVHRYPCCYHCLVAQSDSCDISVLTFIKQISIEHHIFNEHPFLMSITFFLMSIFFNEHPFLMSMTFLMSVPFKNADWLIQNLKCCTTFY